MKQLKKTLIVHLSTTATPTLAQHSNLPPEYVDWRPFLIPVFASSKRLLIDFSPSDLVEVVGAFAQVALRTGGLRARHTSRSFGDCAEFKRRTLVITYPPGKDTDDESLWAAVATQINQHEFQVMVGFENLFSVPDTALIIDAMNLEWLNHRYLKELISQGVLVSRTKVIVILGSAATTKMLLERAVAWNDSHPLAAITTLRDHHGKAWWQGGGEQRRLGPPRPKGAPAPAPEDFTFILEGAEEHRSVELSDLFLKGCTCLLKQKGHEDKDMSTHLWPVMDRSGPKNRILVTGWSFSALRALIFAFNDYSWTSDCGSTAIVKIQNQIIDQQLAHDGSLRLLALSPNILNKEHSCFIDVHGRAPQQALPAPG